MTDLQNFVTMLCKTSINYTKTYRVFDNDEFMVITFTDEKIKVYFDESGRFLYFVNEEMNNSREK